VTRPLLRVVEGPRVTGALFLFLPLLLAGRAAGAQQAPAPSPSLVARADRSWEGMVRRQSGLALSGRWRIGTLAFKEETLRWIDAKDPGRSLVLPAGRIVSHRRVCRATEDAATCFEWSFRAREGETYVFRDERGDEGRRGRIGEVFTFISAILPDIPARTEAGTP
jgi:hypothetical protein